MPVHVVKVDPDQDFYVYWSTITESPYAFGEREWMLNYLLDREEGSPGQAEARLHRADRTGSSALWPSTVAPAFGWDDLGVIYEQRGWLPRYRLRELCDRLAVDQDVDDLLEPLEETP